MQASDRKKLEERNICRFEPQRVEEIVEIQDAHLINKEKNACGHYKLHTHIHMQELYRFNEIIAMRYC